MALMPQLVGWLLGWKGKALWHDILTIWCIRSHIIQTTISCKQPHCMRSYHDISLKYLCWHPIVYYVGYVARPCKSCDTPPFGNCWISAINSLHAVLGPVLVCLKIAGVWTPFQCTNHSTDRGGRGGFVGKVGMSEKDVWASYLNVMKWYQQIRPKSRCVDLTQSAINLRDHFWFWSCLTSIGRKGEFHCTSLDQDCLFAVSSFNWLPSSFSSCWAIVLRYRCWSILNLKPPSTSARPPNHILVHTPKSQNLETSHEHPAQVLSRTSYNN